MLETHFPSIFNISASPFLMNYFGDESKVIMERGEVTKINDLGLLIGYTSKVIPHPPDKALIGPKTKVVKGIYKNRKNVGSKLDTIRR